MLRVLVCSAEHHNTCGRRAAKAIQNIVKHQHPIPGSAQSQAGWSFEQAGAVEGVPALGSKVGPRQTLRSLPTQITLIL